MTRSLLVADRVTHHFSSPQGEVHALQEVSMRVQAGEFVALVGPSGCGKSTLLRMFGGLLTPGQGRVLYDGHPLAEPPDDIGMVFQRPTLLPWRTVMQNIALPLEVAHRPVAAGRVEEMVDTVGLRGFEQALPAELSGGMQQRVALARALIGTPRLLLMDEPFASLDMILRGEMNLLLLDLWHRTLPTVLFVTHDIHEAVFLADRVLTMDGRPGRITGNFYIDLPRPRSLAERYGQESQKHVERLWQALEAAH